MENIIQNHLPEFIAVVTFISGLMIFAIAKHLENKHKNLTRAGTLEKAEIIEHARIGDNGQGFRYEYFGDRGLKHQGSFIERDKEKYQKGDKIEVLYDPKNPAVSIAVDYKEKKERSLKMLMYVAIFELTAMPIITYVLLKYIAEV